MNTKKTSWLNVTTGLMLGTSLAFGATAMAHEHDCSADSNGDEVIDVIDLLNVINQWGVCGEYYEEQANFDWCITSNTTGQPSQGSSLQQHNESHNGVQLWDKNNNNAIWDNFCVSPLNLMVGPSSPTDLFKISATINYKGFIGHDGPANGTMFITGYYNGTTTPKNTSSADGHWYYSDSQAGSAPNCADSSSPVAELDLFESGPACGVAAPGVAAGMPTVWQFTTHANSGGDGGAAGSFLGLGGDGYSLADQNISGGDSPITLTGGFGPDAIGLDLNSDFHVVWTFTNHNCTIHITQPAGQDGSPVDATAIWTPSSGIKDWADYQYFAINISSNDGYMAGSSNGMCVSTERAPDFTSFTVKDINYEVSSDNGADWQSCQKVEGYTEGYHYDSSECSIEGRPLPTGTFYDLTP